MTLSWPSNASIKFWKSRTGFRLDLGQISFNLVENAFCNTTAYLSCHLHCVLGHFDPGMRRNQNFEMRKSSTSLGFSIFGIFLDEKVTYVFRLFNFWNFFGLSFFSCSFLFAAVIDLPLGLLAFKKLLGKHHRDRQFLPWSSQV